MTVSVQEFARRVCLANHRRDFDNAQPAERTVPCGTHTAEARATLHLTQPEGAKTLGVIIDMLEPAKVARPERTLPAEDLGWIEPKVRTT
jgi:hypothetical protein